MIHTDADPKTYGAKISNVNNLHIRAADSLSATDPRFSNTNDDCRKIVNVMSKLTR
jgi:hypothetical protein